MSASYRSCHECIDDLGTQAFPLVAKKNRDEEWFDKDLPHLHSTRVNPLAPPGRRLVQSPFFFLRIGIFTLVDRPIFPFLERSASMAPRAIFLPAVARLVQRIEDRKGAHLGQPIAGLTQCALYQRQ